MADKCKHPQGRPGPRLISMRELLRQPPPRDELGPGVLLCDGKPIGKILEISLVDHDAYPWGGDPAERTIIKGRRRISGTLKLRI